VRCAGSSPADDPAATDRYHDGMMATRSPKEAAVTTYEIRVIGSLGPAAREAFARTATITDQVAGRGHATRAAA